MPAVSIVICSRNRAAQLEKCLNQLSLRINEHPEVELVLVDNASQDETRRRMTDFALTCPVKTKVLYEQKPGLSFARNTALAHATGDLVAFLDDDCFVDTRYLEILAKLAHHREVEFGGGQAIPFTGSFIPPSIPPAMEWLAPRSFIRAGRIKGCVMFFRSSVIRKIGSFDTLLGAGAPLLSGEDSDYVARASGAGFRGGYVPELLVHHDQTPRPRESIDRGYDLGRGAFYFKALCRGQWAYLRGWYETYARDGFPLESLAREFRGVCLYVWFRFLKLFT